MKAKIPFILSFIICALFGTLSHFVYDLSNSFFLFKPYFPIDESVFEHLKLLLYPVLLVSLIEAIIIKKNILHLLINRTLASLFSMIGLVLFYYLIILINKQSIDWLNIVSYYVFLLVLYFLSASFDKFKKTRTYEVVGTILILVIITLFSFFTEFKPDFDFFNDPTSKYQYLSSISLYF